MIESFDYNNKRRFNREQRIKQLQDELRILQAEKQREERSQVYPDYIYTGPPIETEL